MKSDAIGSAPRNVKRFDGWVRTHFFWPAGPPANELNNNQATTNRFVITSLVVIFAVETTRVLKA
jgi:hypothetical protein